MQANPGAILVAALNVLGSFISGVCGAGENDELGSIVLTVSVKNGQIWKELRNHRHTHFSDHRNYWASGFDAVMITDTAFYRNPHYHQASDTPETLDYVRMNEVVEGVTAAVVALARAP